jgi:hypothetical protein
VLNNVVDANLLKSGGNGQIQRFCEFVRWECTQVIDPEVDNMTFEGCKKGDFGVFFAMKCW